MLMISSGYMWPLVTLPVVIDGPGYYVTRSGEVVTVAKPSLKHAFDCIGAYGNDVAESWHKSGRLLASRETANDVVAKQEISSC
jgi:hypothetical protein